MCICEHVQPELVRAGSSFSRFENDDDSPAYEGGLEHDLCLQPGSGWSCILRDIVDTMYHYTLRYLEYLLRRHLVPIASSI